VGHSSDAVGGGGSVVAGGRSVSVDEAEGVKVFVGWGVQEGDGVFDGV